MSHKSKRAIRRGRRLASRLLATATLAAPVEESRTWSLDIERMGTDPDAPLQGVPCGLAYLRWMSLRTRTRNRISVPKALRAKPKPKRKRRTQAVVNGQRRAVDRQEALYDIYAELNGRPPRASRVKTHWRLIRQGKQDYGADS